MLTVRYHSRKRKYLNSNPSEYKLALNEVIDPVVMLLIASNIASIYILESNKSNKYFTLLINNVVTIYLSNLMAVKQNRDLR